MVCIGLHVRILDRIGLDWLARLSVGFHQFASVCTFCMGLHWLALVCIAFASVQIGLPRFTLVLHLFYMCLGMHKAGLQPWWWWGDRFPPRLKDPIFRCVYIYIYRERESERESD